MSVMMSWFRLSHLSSLLLFSLLSKLYTFVIKSHHVTDDAQLHDDNDEIMNSEAVYVDQHERESAKLAFCHLLSKIILIPALV